MSRARADKETGGSKDTSSTQQTRRTSDTAALAVSNVPKTADAWVQEYLDILPTWFVELDTAGRITRINEMACSVLGYERADLIGRDWFEIALPEADRAEVRQVFEEIVSGEAALLRHYQNPVQSRQGEQRLIQWCNSLLLDDGGKVVGTVSSGTDITGHRLVDEQLTRTRRRLEDMETALDASAIVATTDAKGVITFVNDKFVEIAQYPREDLIGRTHKVINSGHHPKSFWRRMWDTIESGEVWRGDIKNKAKDGSFYWVATTIVPFLDDNGKPYQYLAIRSEITQRKEAEQALARAVQELEEASNRERARAEELAATNAELVEAERRLRDEHAKVIQAEKLSSIGLLAAGVAHEVNNPLAGVMGCLKALRSGELAPERAAEYFAAIEDGLERIETIVEGLLAYSRPQGPKEAQIDFSRLIDSCSVLLTPTLRKRGVEIENQIASGSVLIEVDRQQMMQAAMNVLLNAVQASPRGAAVRVAVERTPGRVSIQFRDQGPGIPPEDIARVCDPFFTTKAEGEGTGLGLAVTVGIIQSHGGQLLITSPEEGGTTVTFEFSAPDMEADPAS